MVFTQRNESVKTKHVPLRTCVGCRKIKAKKDLIRMVRTSEAGIVLDTTGKLEGRGAYLCIKPGCFKQAVKRKAMERAFGVDMAAHMERLENEFTHLIKQMSESVVKS